MKKVDLVRIEFKKESTVGILLVDGECVCWVLEEPWRDNRKDTSCIPEGSYPLALEYSPSKGSRLWTIQNVPQRSYVRIHAGNTVDDTQGCPLTGTSPGFLNGKRAVLRSRAAFDSFMHAMGEGSEAQIEVRSLKL